MVASVDPEIQLGPDSALGEAASRLALGFARPAIVAVRMALIVGAIEWIVTSLGFWFVLYATSPEFHPLIGALQAGLLAALGVGALALFGRYNLHALTQSRNALVSITVLVLLPSVPLMAFLPGPDDRSLQLWAVLVMATVMLLPLRWIIRSAVTWAMGTGLTARRAVLAGGDPDEALRVLRGVERQTDSDVKVCAFFDDRHQGRVPELLFEVPKIGSFDDLVAFCQLAEIDLVIVTLPLTARQRIDELLDQMSVLPVAVHLSRASDDFSFPDTRGLGGISATFHAERRVTKRLFDVIVGASALLALSPIMIATAIAVKLTSPGPIFFLQKRHGFNNRVIKVWKFRSMYVDQCDQAARKVVTKGDPRVTPVGRIIRKTSIDELPQLFNVLEGTLSLVGPRPHAVEAQSSQQEPFSRLVRNYSARHRLPPGVTGLAQVNGFRGEISDPEQLRSRVADDLRYIENWSLLLDIQILVRTPLALLKTENAY